MARGQSACVRSRPYGPAGAIRRCPGTRRIGAILEDNRGRFTEVRIGRRWIASTWGRGSWLALYAGTPKPKNRLSTPVRTVLVEEVLMNIETLHFQRAGIVRISDWCRICSHSPYDRRRIPQNLSGTGSYDMHDGSFHCGPERTNTRSRVNLPARCQRSIAGSV